MSTMTDILIHSSNVGMTWVSGQLGPDNLYEYYRRYGLGQPTGLRLPGEVGGTLRTNQDPGWTIVDRATNAYGQGIAVTPVQLLRAVASFGNDGQMVRPRLVRAIRGPDGVQDLPPDVQRQVIAPSSAHTMLQMKWPCTRSPISSRTAWLATTSRQRRAPRTRRPTSVTTRP